MNTDNKRRYSRAEKPEDPVVTWQSGASRAVSRISNLSVGGAFIKTVDPLPVGTNLELFLNVAGRDCHIRGAVRRSIPTGGMGVEFLSMRAEDRACLIATTESSREVYYHHQSGGVSFSPTAYAAEPALSDPADRRSYRRHEISAQVVVIDQETGLPINAQLGGLNLGGCYLKTENPLKIDAMVGITATKGSNSFHSRARVVCHNPGVGMGVMFLDTDAAQLPVLRGWLSESLEKLWLTAERRRTQRVLVQVPVRVTGKDGVDSFIEETQTSKIGTDGCSVTLSMQVSKAQHLMLLNLRTQAAAECAVTHVMSLPDRRYEVGMVFVLPTKKFWPVNFPQCDRSNGKGVS